MSQRTCAFCAEEFTAHDKRMLYCSKSCNRKACRVRRLTADPLPLSDEFTCARCGEFVPSRAKTGPQARYCSSKCREKANYAAAKARGSLHRPEPKQRRAVSCAQCFTEFASARRDARFCSRKCLSAWGRANEKGECAESDCVRPVRAKGLCGKHYKAVGRAEGLISTKLEWTDARRDASQRRRALKKGASTGEPVLLTEIAERDRWTCGLCAGLVDATLAWPDPFSKSLDHVVPLTRGGAHDPSNVQLAHLRCNVAKGNRVA